ncbi:MAG: Crp/Fnr family transcriptional regulator [Bacteroidetes bacterium]|nr:Crp/Fnr family transcriptional regulator [Bacteroidota bacterium]
MRQEKIQCQFCTARHGSLFRYCNEHSLQALDEHKTTHVYKKGQILFFEGNQPLGLFCVNQGAFKVYKTGVDGKEQIIHLAKPGDFLGYRALIANEKYTATAEALETSTACLIPKDGFFEVLERQPELSRKLMQNLCMELGVAAEKLISMAQKSVRERLAETLLTLLQSFQQSQTNTIALQLPREDIANIAGTSTETVIRLLSEFKQDGMIEMSGKKILILDKAALQKVARS